MAEVELLPIDGELAESVAEGAAALERNFGALLRADCVAFLQEQVAATTALYLKVPRELPWIGYLAAREGEIVGLCGFKAGPDEDGVVELAYGTLKPFEGKGIATAMALELVKIAQDSPLARRVIAHTLPKASASTKVLEKVGMRFVGPVVDHEDGPVWLWARDCATGQSMP